ncbi:MerR family transcriptional regulator [Peribacillus sp. TH24]|uniref:MerR family transcriptional regulator n=1 Tax=Peribacillus sp. TH24 TaxID=2798483 RepID=UPI001911CC66|nr:MerR family transcriptional regulator [Peribacillus sp. TH24]MBK5447095.1 MerR family transcriptional regulator [Peribacillus sp. TH24]MBK5447108.1 MerR family transcriptional regulator [Peribacillus sp. TH24]
MDPSQNEIEILYSPGEVSDTLKVKDSTLRKYCGILENAGYHFSKNNRGHRQYTDKDVMTFKKLIAATKNSDMTIETAAEQLVSMYKQTSMTIPATTDITSHEQHSKDIAELKNTVDIQNKLIISLAERLEQHSTYLEDSTKNRDNKLLEHLKSFQKENEELHKEMKLMNEKLEQIGKETAAAAETGKEKGLFARLFGK